MKFTQMEKTTNTNKSWVVIDAKGKVFGRIITQVATILRGKNKVNFTPNVDCGDYVIITNASQVIFTGNKLSTKNYYTHSGYFGSTKTNKMSDMLKNNPEKLFKLATRGMLPKTILGKQMLKKLKVYVSEEHPHTAQVLASQNTDTKEVKKSPTKTKKVVFKNTQDKIDSIKIGTKPKLISKKHEDKPADNLELIKGIGKTLEKTLNELGIYHFDQIASWNDKNIEWVDEYISFKGRIQREEWIEQSKILSKGENTEFSNRVEAGEVSSSRKSSQPKN